MEVKRELSFDDLGDFFWSGARHRWNDATEEQKKRVWDRLNEWFSDKIPSETEVNDAVWFECDDIFNEKDDEMDESVKRRISKSRKLESDDDEFEVMSVEDIANWLSDLYETDVEANWDGDVLTLKVKIDGLGTLPIALKRESSGIDTSTWYVTFDTPNYVYSKKLRLNADDERAYAAELAMKFAKSKDWFKDDFKDDDNEMDESINRRCKLRRVNELRRNNNEAVYYDNKGNYLYEKAEMQKRAEELARVLFSKYIDVKDLYIDTVSTGTVSRIFIKEYSSLSLWDVIGVISLYHKDNEVTVSGSDHVDRFKLGDDLNTSDTVEIADMIKSSPEFDLILKEYNNSLSNKKESQYRRITRK